MTLAPSPSMPAHEVKRTRLGLRLTQKQLSNMLGVDSSTISKYERGDRALPKFQSDIMRAFKIALHNDRQLALELVKDCKPEDWLVTLADLILLGAYQKKCN
jgi:transcriptional regulator with XRE-family HTH domain